MPTRLTERGSQASREQKPSFIWQASPSLKAAGPKNTKKHAMTQE